jgi:hypothetical protein
MTGFRNLPELNPTEPERLPHPVKEFLGRCGVNVSEFPYVRFLIESSEKEIRSGRLYVPLRIPSEPGYIYDSIIRITRVLEIPAVSGVGHRKFLELEWEIDEHPVPEDALHDAIQFLGHEVMCPKCRELFNPDPDILDAYSIRIECSQCLFEWMIRATAVENNDTRVPLLLDLLRADPASMRRYLRQWDQQPIEPTNAFYFSYFPFHFDALEEKSSMDLLFGDQKGLVALSNGIGNDFELLAKGLMNQVTLEYFKRSEFSTPTQALDKTEIQRKEDIRAIAEEIPENTPIVRVITSGETTEHIVLNGFETQKSLRFNSPSRIVEKPPTRIRSQIIKYAYVSLGLFALGFIGFVISKNINVSEIEKLSSKVLEEYERAEKAHAAKITPVKTTEANPARTMNEIMRADPVAIAPATTPTVVAPIAPTPKENQPAKVQNKTKASALKEKTIAKLPAPKISEADQKLKAERVESFYRQGMLHLKLQQSREAEDEFRQVLDIDPKHAPAYRGLGLAYVYDQRFTEAITAFEKYLKMAGDDFDKDSIEELVQTLRDRAANSNPVAKQ